MLVRKYDEVMKQAEKWRRRAYEVLGGNWSKEGFWIDWRLQRITDAYEDAYIEKAEDALKGIQKYAKIIKNCEKHSEDVAERCRYMRANYCW